MRQAESITIVVVCYERELDMLSLLARSVAKYAADRIVAEILLVDNSFEQPDFVHRLEARVIPQLGKFRDRTRVIPAGDLGVLVADATAGYTSQQALKLEVSRIVSTKHYLLLDAKNHFVMPIDVDDLFAVDGRPLAERTIHTAYLATCQRASFEFWGVTPVGDFPTLPTVTPYLMVTDVVRRMLDEIEARGGSVQDQIAENTKRTEFLLYAGYLERDEAVESTYASSPRASATLYARWPQDEATIESVIASAGIGRTYAMGIHTRRFGQLNAEHIDLLARRWVDFGLFDSMEAGVDFIRAQARGVELAEADVLVGRGKRLSIDTGTNGLRDQHRGIRTLSDADAALWVDTLRARTEYCNERGAEYAILIAPDTYSLFAEDFAVFGEDSDARPVAKVLRTLPTEANFAYPLEALRSERASGIIAHTADSHWSAFGAFVAYRELASLLPGWLREFRADEIEFSHRVGSGDLGAKLDPQQSGEFTEAVVRRSRAKLVWNNGVNNRGYIGLWHNDSPGLPRGVLYMDSYGWKFQRFLAESFSSLLIVHSPYLEREPIEMYTPDVVINLMAERFMIRVPDDDTLEPALVTARSKLPTARYPTREEYETGVFRETEDIDRHTTLDQRGGGYQISEMGSRLSRDIDPADQSAPPRQDEQDRCDIRAENDHLRAEVSRLRQWIRDQRDSLGERGRKIEDLRSWIAKLKAANEELRRRLDQRPTDPPSDRD